MGDNFKSSLWVAYPERCLGFILRGVWLAREEDINWFLWDVKKIYPEAHDALLNTITYTYGQTPTNSQEVVSFSYDVLTNSHVESDVKVKLAEAWFSYEMFMSAIEPLFLSYEGLSEKEAQAEKQKAISVATLEAHYLFNHLPFKTNLLNQIYSSSIKNLPCEIIHGRYDMVCPVEEAYQLKAIWPKANLNMVPHSGHYTFEPQMQAQLWLAAQHLEEMLSV